MTPHFFVRPQQVSGGRALLDVDDTRHLVTVLRARAGDPLTVADGSGTVWAARFLGVRDGSAAVELGGSRVEPVEFPALTVVHALPRQRKLDGVVQRLTELGVDRIQPVRSERSQAELDGRKAARAVARWRAIAVAAAKQSRRARLPRIDDIGDWTDAFGEELAGLVCWEESTVGLQTTLSRVPVAERMVVAIGPEGGLTRREVELTGLPHGSLGRTVLRTETAAIVAVAAMRFHYGLMENPDA